jgi:hypothetical protein
MASFRSQFSLPLKRDLNNSPPRQAKVAYEMLFCPNV